MTVAAISDAQFRHALGHFASGVVVITTLAGHEKIGFTCASFYSVSLEPYLVSFCVKKDSKSLPKILKTQRFAVNILSGEQQAICEQFAMRGADKWLGLEWSLSPLGNPLIERTLQWLDCELYQSIEAGDHVLVLGEVKALSAPNKAAPLIYFKGQYGGFSAQPLQNPP